MFYLVYKTINLKNNRFYIGSHTTENREDDYLGSGKVLKRAIKKYGKENFIKIILYEAVNIDEMYNKEYEEVKKAIKDPLCYNLNNGGRGGFHYINDNKLCVGDKNVMRNNEQAKNRCIENGKLTRLKSPQKYKQIALENLKKAVEKNKGKKRPEHAIIMSEWSKENWKNNKEKLRDCLSSTFMLTSPDGKITTTNRLEEFCLRNKIPYVTIWNSSIRNKIVKKGKAKGWLCKKI